MVKGWQRRAEIAVARRVESKQRKQKKDNRASFKGMVSNLFMLMDKHHVTTGTMHVWTDVIPSDSPPVDADEEDSRQKRRDCSGSFDETPGKPRKLSDDGGKGKRAHTRRKEADPDEEEGSTLAKHMCRTQFYKGQCDNLKQGKKSTGCRHVHYRKNHKTLGEVLTKVQKEMLEDAETALAAVAIDDTEEESGGMEMMYYFSIKLAEAHAKTDKENIPIGQVLSKALHDKSCSNASLVYVAYENELIFDRYQEGVLVQELGLVFGDVKRGRSTSVISEAPGEGDTFADAESTPAAALEYILAFLPDTAIASMTRVCKAWHREIGRSSSHLWRQLLDRRNWPHPIDFNIENSGDEIRNCFKMHYQVVRDVNAIKDALSALLNPRRGALDEVEMVYQAFSTRRNAPTEPNACVAMDVWSPNKVIAAYSHDCTIRLFKAVEKGPTGGRACRELISVCVNPYRKTMRRKARLVAMGLDDDSIGCLLHVQGGTKKDENYILSIISRDDYLEAAGGDTASSLGWSELEEGVLNVIDIGKTVVNYVLSADEMDHRLLRLLDFLTDGEDVADVEVFVSHSVVACGHGRFLIEVTISIPDLDAENDDDGEEEEMIMLGRKLVIFSSSIGAIVWMGDSNPSQSTLPRRSDLMLSGVRHGASRISCSVVAVSSSSPTILLSEIDATGQVSEIHQIEAAEVVRAEILSDAHDEWELETERRRPVALFQTDVVAVDVLFSDRVDDSRDHRSIISFYPRFVDDDEGIISYHTKVFDHCNVLYMERIHNQHAMLVCEELERRDTAAIGENERTVSVNAIILHVPTRKVIDRVRLPDVQFLHENLTSPLVVSFGGNTIGVGVWWKGVVMTGSDVRAVDDHAPQHGEDDTNKNRKKKKLARQIYNRKKEGHRSCKSTTVSFRAFNICYHLFKDNHSLELSTGSSSCALSMPLLRRNEMLNLSEKNSAFYQVPSRPSIRLK
jgi:hypothetical protein